MNIALIGSGCFAAAQLTIEAKEVLQKADLVIGAARMLRDLPEHRGKDVAAYLPAEILAVIQKEQAENVCVVQSGDTGFYSGAKKLGTLLWEEGYEVTIYPGISSLQTMASKLGMTWQDWNLCSAHGVEIDVISELMKGKETFFLTGGDATPSTICAQIAKAGLGQLRVFVAEDLGYESEKFWQGSALEAADRTFGLLSVLLVAPAPVAKRRVPGIPDEEFIRGEVPMTKREVRTAILSALRISEQDVCWDIGAGTGSVSVEMALHSRSVWAIEQKPEGCELIRKNREKHLAYNLHVVEGTAPEGLDLFPVPDAVFVGGSGGNLSDIIRTVHTLAPSARICVSAIALETLSEAVDVMKELEAQAEIVQISVSRAKAAGNLHLMMAQNPIFLITGEWI